MKTSELRWSGNRAAQRQCDEAYARLKPKAGKVKPKKPKRKVKWFRGTYAQYMDSPQWRRKRRKAFAIHGKHCSVCGSTKDLRVHHRHYKTLFRENPKDDLIPLCHDCHQNEHEGQKPTAMDPMTREFVEMFRDQ